MLLQGLAAILSTNMSQALAPDGSVRAVGFLLLAVSRAVTQEAVIVGLLLLLAWADGVIADMAWEASSFQKRLPVRCDGCGMCGIMLPPAASTMKLTLSHNL